MRRMLLKPKEYTMVGSDKELFPDFEWQLDFRCERCGEKHDLVFDKSTETMYCTTCLRFLHGLQSGRTATGSGRKADDLGF